MVFLLLFFRFLDWGILIDEIDNMEDKTSESREKMSSRFAEARKVKARGIEQR
jgi:hypothetical protein